MGNQPYLRTIQDDNIMNVLGTLYKSRNRNMNSSSRRNLMYIRLLYKNACIKGRKYQRFLVHVHQHTFVDFQIIEMLYIPKLKTFMHSGLHNLIQYK